MNRTAGNPSISRTLFIVLPAVFFLFCFVFPLSLVLSQAVTDSDNGFTLNYLAEVVRSSYFLRIIWFTVYQAFLSAVFSLLLGIPGAYILAHFTFPGKKILQAVTTVPFVLPSILVVLGFILLFGNNGAINKLFMSLFHLQTPPFRILYKFPAIILAHGFYNFPIAMRVIAAVWEKGSVRNYEAARSLGARGFSVFRTISLPKILPGIISAGSLIFLFCFLSFAVILVLGGGPRFTTMEVEMYRLVKFSLDFKKAAALAAVQLSLSCLFLFLYTKFQKQISYREGSSGAVLSISNRAGKQTLREIPLLKKFFLGIYFLLTAVLIILPLCAVVFRSLQSAPGWSSNSHLSLLWYKQLFTGGGRSLYAHTAQTAIANTLIVSVSTAVLSVLLGTSASFFSRKQGKLSTITESVLLLPMGISTIMLGFGFLQLTHILHIRRGAYILVILAHTVIAFPFVIRTVSPVLQNLGSAHSEAAATLGAKPAQVFLTIEAPLIRPAVIAGGIFAFSLSAGEINATLMLAPRGFVTVPLAIYRLIGAYNYFGACALGSVLIFLCAAAFYFVDKFLSLKDI